MDHRRPLALSVAAFAALAVAIPPARADVALGVFVAQPTGLDLKLGLDHRSALDFVFGRSSYREGFPLYAHATYLLTVADVPGNSVSVPVRVGIGGAVFGPSDDLGLAVRAPFELGLRFRSAPIEIYAEIALFLQLHGPGADPILDVQGGFGLRLYL
jgi:hypothetical protein